VVYFYIFLAIAAGVALSTQIGVNNALRISLNSSVFAAFFSFAIGTAGLLVYRAFNPHFSNDYPPPGSRDYTGWLATKDFEVRISAVFR
jgi:uncharacterized membrane protein YdcZ (DUF606 family)